MDTKSIDANLNPSMDTKDDDLVDAKQALADGYEMRHLLMGTKSIDTNSMDSNMANPDRYKLMQVDRYEVSYLPMDSNKEEPMDSYEIESNRGTSMDSNLVDTNRGTSMDSKSLGPDRYESDRYELRHFDGYEAAGT